MTDMGIRRIGHVPAKIHLDQARGRRWSGSTTTPPQPDKSTTRQNMGLNAAHTDAASWPLGIARSDLEAVPDIPASDRRTGSSAPLPRYNPVAGAPHVVEASSTASIDERGSFQATPPIDRGASAAGFSHKS